VTVKPDDDNSRVIKPGWFFKPFIWLLAAVIGFLCRVLLVTWATLAIYHSNLPWDWLRLSLEVAFVAFSIWALWLTRRPGMSLGFAGVFLCVLVWWICSSVPPFRRSLE